MKVHSNEELQTALAAFMAKADPESEVRIQVDFDITSLGDTTPDFQGDTLEELEDFLRSINQIDPDSKIKLNISIEVIEPGNAKYGKD
jgi:hypothetical protein